MRVGKVGSFTSVNGQAVIEIWTETYIWDLHSGFPFVCNHFSKVLYFQRPSVHLILAIGLYNGIRKTRK
jgi:hypothetical protein